MTNKIIINNWTGGGTLQTWTDGEWQILYAKDSAENCVTLSLNSGDAIRLAYAVLPTPSEIFERWRSISEDTSWLDGRDVVLLAHDMEVQARYCPGEWSDETSSSPREYSGAVWSCFDDQFQLEIEETSEDPSEWGHDGATHWRPISTHPHASDCDKQGER